jgi:hypothetical protein
MAARGFIGAGDLYIARYANGAFGAYEGPFECNKLSIKPNVDTKELVSKGRLTYGQVIESVAIPQPYELAVELSEVNSTSLALALTGTTGALAQASGTLAAEAVTVTLLDRWYPLTKAALSTTGVTVKNAGGTVTYVEGVDYLLNRVLGWVKALPGGGIAAASAVQVNGPYLAISGTEINASATQVRAKFKLDGKNFADDSPCIVTIHEAVVAADGEFDFLADDFGVVSLPGRMKTPAGFTSPYTVHLRDA